MSQPPITPEQMAALPPEFGGLFRAVIDYYERRISGLEAELTAVRAELAALKKTPRNSSLPPSSQHPHAKPARRPPPSKKNRGGQPGHDRRLRALISAADCQQVIACKPTHCRRCRQRLSGSDPEPLRHQVWDVPEIKPLVTEYQRHRLTCSGCGETSCGPLPAGASSGQAGPRLIALAALLMGCYRQSKRRTALFLEQVLGQPCSTGWVVKLQNQATAALRPAYRELQQQLPTQTHLGIDETPTKELFRHWSRCRDGTLARAGLKRLMHGLRLEVEALLLRGVFRGKERIYGMCRELYEHRDWLWTFLDVEPVEPTNNASERALRHAVIWRKLSFGTQSARGSRFVETLLSVVETCRQQSRSVFAFVTEAVKSRLAGHPTPSLLPRV